MDQGTKADYDIVFAEEAVNVATQAERVMRWLAMMDVESVSVSYTHLTLPTKA